MRKISMKVGDQLGAVRAADYLVEEVDSPQTFARGDYWVVPELGGRDLDGGPARANTMWLGSPEALAKFGLERGTVVTSEALSAVLQGRHAVDPGIQVRTPGWRLVEKASAGRQRSHSDPDQELLLETEREAEQQVDKPGKVREATVASIDMTFSAPKSVSVLWSAAGPEQRRIIEQAVMRAANVAMEYMVQTKKVVNLGKGVRDFATGGAWSQTLHVTARRAQGEEVPSPQLHVHAVLVGVTRSDGALVAPDSWALFRKDAPLEGGAVFRAALAEQLMGLYPLRAETGRNQRFFEVDGVPDSLIQAMSGRARDVEAEIRRRELLSGFRLRGAGLSVVAADTRAPKDKEVDPARVLAVWRGLQAEHGFGPEQAAALMESAGLLAPAEERREQWRKRFMERMREGGPARTAGMARAIAFELAPLGATVREVEQWLGELERAGELIALEGEFATLGAIRADERYVMTVASAAARRPAPGLSTRAVERGIARANARLGKGKSLDDEQLHAVRRLTGGAGWVTLTGRAGTGKGPTLHAIASAYRADDWQVIATAAEGQTAERLGHQVQADAYTLESVVRRVEIGSLRLDARTVLVIDEATKVSLRYWKRIADWVEQRGVRVLAVGHEGQLDAIDLPGMFGQMLKPRSGIPNVDLNVIRRHRDPYSDRQHAWLVDYQIAVDSATDVKDARAAVQLLVDNNAITFHDGRETATAAMVAEWDEWRHGIGEHRFAPDETLLLVHGSNEDVDFVNQLAQARRHAAGELGAASVKATDRDYRFHVGDVVVLRNAPYELVDNSGERRKVVNGQSGIVTAVDERRRAMTVQIRRPNGSLEQLTFDLNAMEAAGPRAAAWRLGYASHVFPAQGATVRGTSVFAGHWSQSKEATYVGDTRGVFRHSVHIAREDVGLEGTDKDRLDRYAKRIWTTMKRRASIDRQVDARARVAPNEWVVREMPEMPLREPARTAEGRASEAPAVGGRAASVGGGRTNAERTARRRAPDLLDAWRGVLGERRAAALSRRADTQMERLRERSREWLRARRDELGAPLEKLDRAAARELATIERDRAIAKRQLQASTARAEQLNREAEALTGYRQRKRRNELLAEAAQHEHMAAKARIALGQLKQAERHLRDEGRHFDRWAAEHRAAAEEWLAVERLLAAHRERATEAALERAVSEPPAHLVEAIGRAPEPGTPQRREWETLARALERDRVTAEVYAQDGLMPPRRDPLEQRRLEQRIERLRVAQGLGARERVTSAERPAPGARELAG